MSQPQSPLASPEPWNLVSSAYAEEIVPQFERYAEDALRLAGVREDTRVLDVACGPGTLALLAARRGATVDALDFAERMVEKLQAASAREGLTVNATVGDGQQLPFASASYDAGFSMFGLMFFPDRARGFAELARCVVPGGTIVVSSWQPMEANVPFIAAVFAALRERIPGLPFGGQEAPLSEPGVFRDEMLAAGLSDVAIHDVRHTSEFPSTGDVWASMVRTMAPLAMLARKMGDAWPALEAKLRGDLVARFGEDLRSLVMPAWLGVGRVPA